MEEKLARVYEECIYFWEENKSTRKFVSLRYFSDEQIKFFRYMKI